MARSRRFFSVRGGREVLLALGGLYVVFGLGYPFLPGIDSPFGIDLIMVIFVGGPGVILLYAGYRIPRSDIAPELVPVVSKWCLGGIGAMLGLIAVTALAAGLSEAFQNVLILTAIGSVAGLAAGTYDARAKTRARALERRNQKLHRTQVELEETVARLEESEQRYRTLAENFPNGAVSLLDDELRYTLVAGKGFDRVDVDADDLRDERLLDVYSDDLLGDVEPHFRDALDGEPSAFEVELQGRTFEFRTHPLTDDDGDVSGVLAMSQDVTERKRRERELTKQARQQRVVADLGQFALETDDLDELMSQACRQVVDTLEADYCKVLDLEANREELRLRQGVGWRDGLVGDATVSAVEEDSQAAYTLARDHPIIVEDLETETRFSGPELLRSHDVKSGISTVVGPVAEPWGILGVHSTDRCAFSDEDVSFVQSVSNVLAEAIERDQYQADLEGVIADLEESNRRLEQFAYAASHDLQEPLRMVSSYLRLIERRYEDDLDEEGREFLAFAVDGADRMRSMIDGLLAYSRVETEGDPLEPVELEAVVDTVREDLQVKIEETDATVTREALPRVEGDRGQLRQVFHNLFENAIKYSGPEPPRIHVSSERVGDVWRVSVRDDGIGIDADDQEHVFEVFQRVHSRRHFGGAGIGLALCQRIVDRHGGEIWIESEPGEGTTVSFTLPAASEYDERPRTASQR